MRIRGKGWAKLGLALAAVAIWVSPPLTVAKQGPFARAGARPVLNGWAEVVSVTNKWLVLQNARGQQYPVASNAVDMFVIRWPTTPARVSPNALVEATGIDSGSLQLTTDHVDVYEGAARSLVTPTFMTINGAGNVNRPIDYVFDAQVYGEAFPGIAPPIHGGLPFQLPQIHVVGPLVNANPVQIGNQGANAVTVVPAGGALSMTQITPGSFAQLRPGDAVFFVATAIGARSLTVSHLIVYKNVPMD